MLMLIPFYESPKIPNTHYIHDYGLIHPSDSTAWLSPSTASNEVLAGSNGIWGFADNSKTQSDSYAIVLSLAKGKYSDYLRVVDFGFSLPESTIDGIEIGIDKFASNSLIQDYDVYLVLSGSTIGDDYAKIGIGWALSDTDTYTLYGGVSDTWNAELSYSDINDATFGVEISAINTKTGSPATYSVRIDHIRIKIHYTITEVEHDPPTWDTLIESDDPLELGATETININVYDVSTISEVYIEIDSVNNSMSWISGDTWRYSTWTPSSVGIKIYQIHMIDEHNNIAQTDDLDITVQDTTNPVIDNVIESADPLELGQTETIECDITDYSDMEFVYLEFEGSNNSMSFVSGIKWEYTTWTPSSIGNYPYTIWANDTEGNIYYLDSDITVQDTLNPVIDNIIESADPLELGQTELIECDITDESDIYFVYLEFEGNNYSMSFVSGIKWEYTTWTPSSIGNYPYTIWANDTEGNINHVDGDITVQDTSNPVIDNIIESADPLELGQTETIECDITDYSEMYFVYLEFEGNNYSMSFVSGIKWEYTTWTPSSVGNNPYTIWANDTEGNIGYSSSSIDVIDTTNPVIDNVIESADPLELGQTETIECDITDYSEMYFVYLEFEDSNNSMNFVSGIKWEYTTWTPSSIGNNPYTIWANDTEGNIHYVDGDIMVQDTTNPVIDNVIESADPLEFGQTETIECNITDESDMYFVYLEFEGNNYSMSFVSGIKWQYTTWTPSSVGNNPYTIWANDTEGNIHYIDSDIMVQDTTNPVIDNVIESADPLTLGNIEVIDCDITDYSEMYFVYLEFEGNNYSMTFISGNNWRYSTWQPSETGNYPYTIWANDTEGNIQYIDGNITVQEPDDTDPPTFDTITESGDPLELGATETININVYDANTISNVYIEIDFFNNSMSYISGDTWRYSIWTPLSVGIKTYQIHMIDEYNNINQTDDLNITVQDTTNPVIDNVIESADPLILGNIEVIDCDITDYSEMYFVYLEFEGNNYSMTFISGINWRYSTWQPSETGNYPYTIWANDTEGNIHHVDGDITVNPYIDDVAPSWSNLIEISDPLEIGNNITIQINVYDYSIISNVYIEINDVNYTMSNISSTYSYSNWLPNKTGYTPYIIWMIDEHNNIGSISGSILVIDTPYMVLSLFILFSLLIFTLFLYFKARVFLLILILYLFSIIIGMISITENVIPFSPYFEMFFLLFQSIIFIFLTIQFKEQKNE